MFKHLQYAFYALLLSLCLTTNAQTLIIAHATGDYYPYEYNENGKFKGIHADIIVHAATELKVKIEFRAMPWKRAIKALEQGQVDALSYLSHTEKRSKFALFLAGNVLSRIDSYPIILKSNLDKIHYDGKIQTLKPYRIAVGLGFIYGEPFDSATSLTKVPVSIPSRSKLKQMLELKRVDIAVGTQSNYDIDTHNPQSTLTMLTTPIASNYVYLAWHKNTRNLAIAESFAISIDKFRNSKRYQQKLEWYQTVKHHHQHSINKLHP